MIGIVRWFDTRKGYGFIRDTEGRDVFAHYTDINKQGFRWLRDGERVEYEQIETPHGLRAKNMVRLGSPNRRPPRQPRPKPAVAEPAAVPAEAEPAAAAAPA